MSILKGRKGILTCCLVVALASCANRSQGPQGGPKDITPPAPKKSVPANGETNFKGKEISILFDEFVSLDKPQEKVIISPPQMTPASIVANGKKITVTLNDSLQPNTCYSIDFTNSIQDLNEKNTLEGYTLAFTTGGEAIDSMQVSGVVVDAETLNPLKNKIVGIYSNLSDTAVTKLKPLRIGRTDENGLFSIKNIKTGNYKIYALGDKNGNYEYDDPTEEIAFLNRPITTTSEMVLERDTVKRDSAKGGDSIIVKKKTVFHPNDLLLKAYSLKNQKQSFIKAERKDARCIKLYFNAPNKELPTFSGLDGENPQMLASSNETKDSINYWITDSASYNKDMLRFALTYPKTDNDGKTTMQTDTVRCYHKHFKHQQKKNKEDMEVKKITLLNVKTNTMGDMDLNKGIIIDLEYPVKSFDLSKVHLQSTADSVWKDEAIKVQKDDELGMRYSIPFKWDSNLKYRLTIDSTAINSIYEEHNKGIKSEFKVKPMESYATLIMNLVKYNADARLQLLDKQDKVKIELPASKDGTEFDYITPGDYYLRLYIDENRDGKWTAGDYGTHRQPEAVYYFNQMLKLRANWEIEQDWDYTSMPQEKQKPNELKEGSKKNK